MNKLLASLFAVAALSLATSTFAADAPKPAEPAKVEAAAAEPAKTEAAKPAVKHHHKHAKKAAVAAPAAAPAAPAEVK